MKVFASKSIFLICFTGMSKIIFAQTPPGFGVAACPVTAIDLELYSGDSGTPIPETYEQLPVGFGGATVANKNDSDADGIVDNLDPLIFSGGIGISLGENIDRDLMQLTIYRPQGCPAQGEVLLNVLQGQNKVNFFEKQNKDGKITNLKFKCNKLPKSIFMEITDNSQTLGDVEVELKYNAMSDKVNATAIWVDKTNVWVTRCPTSNPSCNQPNDNPEPGVGNLSKLDGTGPAFIISKRRAKDGSRYGHGYNNKNNDGIDRDDNFGGRVLFEYKIFPTLAPNVYQNLGIDFDVTRRRKSRKLECAYGGNPTSGVLDPFPALNDEANDDENNNQYDEDNIPNEGFIYSWDAPGIPLYKANGSIDSDWAFKCVKTTFEEFIRVGIWNDIPNVNANGVFGSRASGKTPWHCVYYMKSGADLRLEPDGSLASFSGIKEKGGTLDGNDGNGTCSIELKSSPISNGFNLIYASGKWKFNGAEVAENPPGKWIYENGNNIKITITKGSVPFYDGDKFLFSVFVSSNKINSTAISEFQGVESDF